jgi:hypothetical protein
MDAYDGPNEQSVLKQYLSERHNITIVHADPTELRIEGNEVYCEVTCLRSANARQPKM